MAEPGARRVLTWAEIEAARATRWAAALLHITDSCPVGCAHCSVASRPDGPRVTDFALLEQMIDGLCAVESFEVVGVSGGEPVVERRALSHAAERITAAGKHLVLYTSGLWGTPGEPPAWIGRVLRLASCVVLSRDAFHVARLSGRRFAEAARAVVGEGCRLVCQVLDTPREHEQTERALTEALGEGWPEIAEIRPVPLLPFGRAARLPLGRPPAVPGSTFGRCHIVDTPVIRYDGWVLGCCNEKVVMGAGPAALRRRVTTGAGVADALTQLRDDHLLSAFGRVGLGPLTAAAPYRDLADQPAERICDLCWRILDRKT